MRPRWDRMPTNAPSPFSRQLDAELQRLRGQVRAGWTDVFRDADVRTWAGWMLVLRRIGPKRLLLGIGGLALVLFLLVPLGGESSDPLDGPVGAIDLFVKLGIVVVLAYASLAMLKRYTVGATRSTSLLQVLDSTTLAPNRSVYVVRVGEKRLVLGVTQNQISTLAELEPEAPAASELPELTSDAYLDEAFSDELYPDEAYPDALLADVRVSPASHRGNGRRPLLSRAPRLSREGDRSANGTVPAVTYAVEPPYGSAVTSGRPSSERSS